MQEEIRATVLENALKKGANLVQAMAAQDGGGLKKAAQELDQGVKKAPVTPKKRKFKELNSKQLQVQVRSETSRHPSDESIHEGSS